MVDNLLKVIVNDRKRKSEILKCNRCPLFYKCYRRYWGKYDFSYDYIFYGHVVNKLKRRELFPDRMNRNHLT